MLRIAQIEAGARRARFANSDLSSIADNVFEAFAAVAKLYDATISLEDNDPVWHFVAQALNSQLHQAYR